MKPLRHPRFRLRLLTLALAVALPADAQWEDTRPGPRAPRAAVFFPPFPPPLDQTIARGVPAPSALPVPPELKEHVAEIYYPQLSTRLATEGIPEALRGRLSAYRNSRSSLTRELTQVLEAHAQADPTTRAQALAELARRQTTALTRLETEAEELRRDLIAPDRDWSAYRDWWLGEKERRGFSPLEAALVIRASAHYLKGLLPEQRRLAREIAVELAQATDSTTAAPPTWIFFDPAPARIILPTDLSPEAARRLAAFQSLQASLKKELFDTIAKQDGKYSILTSPLRDLAARQAPKLQELSELAESVRTALPQDSLRPTPLTSGPLSATLVGRLDTLSRKRLVQQRGTIDRVSELLARVRQRNLPVLVQYRFERDGLHFTINPARGTPFGSDPEAATAAVRAEAAVIAEDYGRTLVDLVNEGDAIRREIATALGTDDPRRIEATVGLVMRSLDQREQAAAYNWYRIAVLAPGLTPAQRRLLLDEAVERLDLPLPAGDLQPAQRGGG